MKKRIGFLSLFAVTALLVAMIGAISVLGAPSAAPVTGTISLDKSWYTVGGAVKVTVKDADVNVATTQPNQTVAVAAEAATTGQFVQLNTAPVVGTPVVAPVGGTTADAYASTVANVSVINADLGRVTLFVDGVTVKAGDNVDIIYKTSAKETLQVTVKSTQDSTGITVTATETGFDTGEFAVTINLVDATATSSNVALKNLATTHLDTLTAEYKDTTPASGTSVTVTATATVETDKPGFSSLVPVDKFSTRDKRTGFAGTVTDSGGSGIDVSTVLINIDGADYTPVVTGSDGDSSVTFTYTPTADLAEGNHAWYVKASDMAGNQGRSDAVPDVTGKAETIGDQDNAFKIDNTRPTLASAETGKFWDTSKDPAEEGSNKHTSVVAIFDDELDPGTVEPTDFQVEGVVPLSALVVTSGTNADAKRVYLALDTPLAANAKPVVRIASGGVVSDKAGNTQDTGSVTASDKIKPTLTVTPSVTLTKSDVEINIASDEEIAGLPKVEVFNIDGVTSKTLAGVLKTTSTTFSVKFTKDVAYEGKNSIVVTATDLANNSATKGDGTVTAGKFSAKAITFTLDTTAPTATKFEAAGVDITVADAEVPETSPFITITFGEKVTIDKAEFGLASATALTDVTADGKLSTDGKQWIYAASNLTVKEKYTIKVTATDEAGNTKKDQSASFTVKEKALVSIPLAPGMNLISLPGEPADPAINSVITVADVTSVITYDSATGQFLSATRDAAGLLTGDLTTIDAQHGYWVNTTSFAPIKVDIPGQATGGAFPPFIPVVAGWNLVPVVSVSGAAPGTAISADTYFGSVKWVTAYTFEPPDTWIKVLPKNFQTVTVGKGYWVFVTEAGILVP